ncbi:monocarboxylate transporter 12-like [Aricia agestis]|uniref:monocarboxylate transporter 12-like n=1 Tax=Aricia agestis TaxID=91739 RepID=UPI001C2041B6|nr:monocarboxylate transporter 12-like [Aricia agestis]
MNNGKSKRVLEAPDGGWGYMIVVAVVIHLVIFETFTKHHSVLYKDLYVQVNMDASAIASLDKLTPVIFAISGFTTSSLLKLMSIRKLALLAATVLSCGQVTAKFIENTALLFITQGVIQGLTTGILFNICFTVIIQYFDKRRLLAVSIVYSITTAITALVSPRVIRWSLDRFGGHGAILFLSAVTMNTILGACLMQPVSMHIKKVHLPETREIELKVLLNDKEVQMSQTGELMRKLKSNKDWRKKLIDKFLGDYMDIMIRKKFLLSIAPLGLALAGFADATFITMLPRALRQMRWNATQISWAISLQEYGDFLTKIIFVVTSHWINKFSRRELYVAGLVIALFARIGMLWSDNPTIMLIFLTMMGIPRCSIILLAPLVVAEAVGVEKFSAAFGIVMLMSGITNFVLTPVMDSVLGLTGNYPTVFYILASFYGIILMFWSIELLYKKNKHKWVIK